MQRILLSDDELWRAIVENTDAMLALIHEWIELEAGVGAPSDGNSWLMQSNAQRIDKFERQYQEYTGGCAVATLRRCLRAKRSELCSRLAQFRDVLQRFTRRPNQTAWGWRRNSFPHQVLSALQGTTNFHIGIYYSPSHPFLLYGLLIVE